MMSSSRVLLLVALSLACSVASASSFAAWSSKPFIGAAGNVDAAIQQIVQAKPEIVLFIVGNPSSDASLRNVLSNSLAERTHETYLPFTSNAVLEKSAATLAKKLAAATVQVESAADLASLSFDLSKTTVVIFTAPADVLAATIAAVEAASSETAIVYSVHTPTTKPRMARSENGVDAPLPVDYTDEKALEFATTFTSLFEAYTLFSPGTFMGIMVLIVLITTLLIGFSCLVSLQTPTQFEKND